MPADDADFVDQVGEMIVYFTRVRGMSDDDGCGLADAVTSEIRAHFSGERVSIRKSAISRRQLAANIRRDFNGTNLDEIMERYRVSRSTVYRYAAVSDD